jgi:hypothetical protein
MKRTRRQSNADGELGQVVSPDAGAADDVAKSPDHKRTRTAQSDRDEGEAKAPVEADVRGIVTALRAKPEWARKVADPTIVAKWRAEALAQGASASSVAEALARLLRESVVGAAEDKDATTGAALGCSLSIPSEEERDRMLDQDDRDFWLEESDEAESKPREDVCWRDGLVPEELRAALEAKLDAIAAAPNKDFHPGSDNKVQPPPRRM